MREAEPPVVGLLSPTIVKREADTMKTYILRERAELKSRRDDMIIAPGKRSAARGCGSPPFSFWFGAPRAQNQKEKEKGWDGFLLETAAARRRFGCTADLVPTLTARGVQPKRGRVDVSPQSIIVRPMPWFRNSAEGSRRMCGRAAVPGSG
jgi:hypothetical protein